MQGGSQLELGEGGERGGHADEGTADLPQLVDCGQLLAVGPGDDDQVGLVENQSIQAAGDVQESDECLEIGGRGVVDVHQQQSGHGVRLL